jgi:hypothetical protein
LLLSPVIANTQKREQSFMRSVRIRSNAGEDGFEVGHATLQDADMARNYQSL